DGIGGPYILISSVSAYAEPSDGDAAAGFTEDSPLARLPDGIDPASEEVTGETYGPLKVLTEGAAKALLPGAVMVVRPGLIVGPHDPTDRFTYWVRRMADGGEVLAPESPDLAQTQVVHAADMAEWIVASAADGRTGTYNAVAPPVPLAHVLDAAGRAAVRATVSAERPAAEVIWVPWEFLEAEGVAPWVDLPAWVPAPMARLLAADGSRAAAAGLPSRPVDAVVADVAAWDRTRAGAPVRTGLSRERETELLSRFRAAGPPPGP
ncbi:MAG: hypothetical protein QOF96_2475, partial [Actinomycetota bacterium]|nr:hypothetical protein [Actinomycetota bacterium]